MKGDVMDWSNAQQTRFDELRKRELSDVLTAKDKIELAEIVTSLEQEEARYLGPAVVRMEAEQAAMREQLQAMQDDNEELAKLFHQQEQLVVEARRWLADFQQRHQRIQTAYTRLTNDTLATT